MPSAQLHLPRSSLKPKGKTQRDADYDLRRMMLAFTALVRRHRLATHQSRHAVVLRLGTFANLETRTRGPCELQTRGLHSTISSWSIRTHRMKACSLFHPIILFFLPLNLTSSSLLITFFAPLKLPSYASSTTPNMASSRGCVEPKARSSTYKSTARSSS